MSSETKKERSQLEKLRRSLILSGRSIASIPGATLDMAQEGVINPLLRGFGKNEYTTNYSDNTKKLIDKITGNTVKADTPTEHALEGILEMGIGGGRGKIMNAVVPTAGKVATAVKSMVKPTAASSVGSGASRYLLEENPDNTVGALAAGFLGSAPALAKSGYKTLKNIPKAYENNPITNMLRNKDLNRIKANPNLAERVENHLGHKQGATEIESRTHKETGKGVQKATQNIKNHYKEYFGNRYKKIDDYYNKLTENNKNSKRNVDVTDTVNYIEDQYKLLTDPIMKEAFLKTKSGEQLLKLRKITAKDKVSALEKSLKYEKDIKATYHDARELQREIQNTLSKAQEIGTQDQGRLRQISEKLGNNIGSVFKDDPNMHSYWRDTNKEYVNYLGDEKAKINLISKHKDPTKAYQASTDLSSTDMLDFLKKGMNAEEHSSHTLGVLRDLGAPTGSYKPTTAQSNLAKLQPEVRNTLMESLLPNNKKQISETLPLLKQFEFEKAQPKRETALGQWFKKKLPLSETNRYAATDQKTVDRTINALQHQVDQSTRVPNLYGKELALPITRQTGITSARPRREIDPELLSEQEIDNRMAQIKMDLNQEDNNVADDGITEAEIDNRMAKLRAELAAGE